MRGESRDGVHAGGSDRGVRVTEAARDGGEHFREIRIERVSVSLRKDRQEAHALFAHWGLVGRVSGLNAREESGELRRVEGPGDRFEFGHGYGVCVPVGELGKAREDPVLEVLCHCVGFSGSDFGATVLAVEPPGFPATLPEMAVEVVTVWSVSSLGVRVSEKEQSAFLCFL